MSDGRSLITLTFGRESGVPGRGGEPPASNGAASGAAVGDTGAAGPGDDGAAPDAGNPPDGTAEGRRGRWVRRATVLGAALVGTAAGAAAAWLVRRGPTAAVPDRVPDPASVGAPVRNPDPGVAGLVGLGFLVATNALIRRLEARR